MGEEKEPNVQKKKREPEQLCQINQATLPDAGACMWSLLARWVTNLAMHGDASQHQHQCKCRACAQLTHCVEIGTMQLHSDKPTAFHFTAATTMNHMSQKASIQVQMASAVTLPNGSPCQDSGKAEVMPTVLSPASSTRAPDVDVDRWIQAKRRP